MDQQRVVMEEAFSPRYGFPGVRRDKNERFRLVQGLR